MDDISKVWTPYEEEAVSQMISCTFVGSPVTIAADLTDFLQQTGVNEIMATSAIYDHQARVHSYKILADVFNQEINS